MNEPIVTVVGNLTADPELRFLPSGAAMVRFSVASTPRYRDNASGQYKDGEPLFMRCTAWRGLAENIAESLQRGARVMVTGRLRMSHWQAEDGQKRQAIGLEVDEVGPSLRFATATVRKMSRSGGAGGDGFTPDNVPDDPWASASPERPLGAAA
ncbi:single-stranded DNA-binding protein [Dactylosporangium sp. AC04546]|uniref:single-stranded DNA-binding protein n=1 Tax=Dactylosporangium sp. AC04546 TaxID=2862460 RepID=UPI001EE14586|nr:single-stranded DNA-binding protein [Dactylosporangium sp. AC04546]WVK82010.1 single-stranded DNA-binding protein [Dactylosporangium sp. AC04546]